MPFAQPVRADFVQALLSLVGQGIRANQLDDAEEVLDALRVLSPNLPNIDEFLPYIAIKRGFARDALQMYAARPVDESRWFAMMGLCLKLLDDPTWHWHATQALEKVDATSYCAHGLAKVLLGHAPSTFTSVATLDTAESPAVEQQFEDPTFSYLHYRSV